MRAVVSTVHEASVTVDGEVVGAVDADRDGAGRGALLALVGVGREDGPDAWRTVARKIAELRILPRVGEPWDGVRDAGAQDNGAEILVVSQFTLMGATAKGRRPSWSAAAPGPEAEEVITWIVEDLRGRGLRVETGVFGAMMDVRSTNAGPYTVVVEAE
ncbi:D-aminoacyl-tRNA deacylase [Corynebacterium sp.]|uniref:D-aminoacyl-tRNA deacylase n=1 Tax=Corynebacterium sp. TaxID=1720 RepID=UPI0025BAA15C|nr:D-aminoacyl-tRNA deacylase [Corynebacterium sp.]